jgi:hypothetical protein
MSSNSVPQKNGEIQEDGLSRIQQMEFMFGELMTRIEKLETKSDGGRSKGVEKLGRRRVLLETLQMKSRIILIVVMGSLHIRKRGMRIGQGGDIFDHIGILSIEGILMIWEI